MRDLLADFFIKAIGRLFPLAIRWYYTPERIAKKIKIRVRGSGDGIIIYGGELPHVKARVEITNLSPFPLDFDRIYGHFWYGTRLAAFYYLNRTHVEPAHEIEIFLESDLTKPQSEYIEKNKGKMNAKLSLAAFVQCKVNNIDISCEVPTNNVCLSNFG